MSPPPHAGFAEEARGLLERLGADLRAAVLAARAARPREEMARVAQVTASDTIYQIDKIGEAAIIEWFGRHWPAAEPVELVMEGNEDDRPRVFPPDTPANGLRWKCLLDPIDGTRNLLYDKRPGWVLAMLAPHRGQATRYRDVVVAAMTELPTAKQARADQASVVRGCGPAGIRATGTDLRTWETQAVPFQPSQALDFRHGFAAICRFFPEGLEWLARIEEKLWAEIHGTDEEAAALVFSDQYICTGGQMHELLAGHDRMIADLRPLVFAKLGRPAALACHPYDMGAALILEEAGAVLEHPDGSPLDFPLDTTTPIAWVGYANPHLASIARPVLQRILAEEGLIEGAEK